MGKKKHFICPYCFEKKEISEVQFRCTNKRCVDVGDIEYTKYEHGDVGNPVKRKRTFIVSSKSSSLPQSAECQVCHNVTYKRVCPSCHNELPESTLTGDDMIISVVGSRGTGKSHFVGVIIKELRDRISVSFGGSLEGFADSYQRWEKHFYDSLYNGNITLELTKSSVQNTENGAYKPLIFKLKLKKKSFFRDIIESFTLVFFDTAGEDLNDEDTMSTVNKYICKSSGIIFLLDPTQIPAVAEQLEESTLKGAAAVDYRRESKSDDIMTRVSNLIRNDKGISDTEKIDIPVAVVFSKFDALEKIVPSGCTVLDPSPHCTEKYFDLSDWHNVNSEISALLREWDAKAFISQLETNYNNYSYFAVSALGMNNNPGEGRKIERPRPHRIEDPFLWILNENGVIKGK